MATGYGMASLAKLLLAAAFGCPPGRRPGRAEGPRLSQIAIVVTAFGVVFIGELPDKTAVASLVLGARYSPLPVLVGVWAAFAVHVSLACVAGGLVARLPRGLVELVTGTLFLIGAVLLLRSNPRDAVREGEQEAAAVTGHRSPGRQRPRPSASS